MGWLRQLGHRRDNVPGASAYDEEDYQPTPAVLQALGRAMLCTEVAGLRQVSKQWRQVLSHQVSSVVLPQQAWQHPQAGHAAAPGTDVLLVFPAVSTVQLSLDPMQPLSAPKLHSGFQRLAQVPSLRHLVLKCFTQPQHWEQVARSLPLLGQQLTALTLAGATWPTREQLAGLQRLPRLQSLDFTCPHLSRLEQPHLEVIAGLVGLRRLRLAFRIVAGTAHTPLCLAPLSALTGLEELTLEFMGLRELSCAASLHPAAVLASLQRLRRLEVLHIPCDSLGSLKQLTALTHLSFHQSEAVTAAQLAGIAACSSLRALHLQPVAWEDLPALRGMQGLQQLRLQLHTARRSARRALEAGHALTALTGLTGLQEVSLDGAAAITSSTLVTLGGCWQQLTSLQLCCTLPQGSVGLGSFRSLKRLSLSPYDWDCWSNEPPLLLYPVSLPTTLTSLEALDVWVAPDAPPSCAVTLPTPHLRRLVLRTLSPCERPLLLPDWGLAQQCEQLELSHSQLMSEHLHHIAALQARALSASSASRSKRCKDAADTSSSSSSKRCKDSADTSSSSSTAPSKCVESLAAAGSSGGGGGQGGVPQYADSQLFHLCHNCISSEHLPPQTCPSSSGGGSAAAARGVAPRHRNYSLVSTISRRDTVSTTVSSVDDCDGDAVDRRDSTLSVTTTLSSSSSSSCSTGAEVAELLDQLVGPPTSSAAAAKWTKQAPSQALWAASQDEPSGGLVLPSQHAGSRSSSSSSSSRGVSPEVRAKDASPPGTERSCYSIVDMQQLRPLRLCSSPPAPQGLGHWRLLLSQWKHKMLLRMGATLSSWEGAHQGYSRGGWGLAGSAFELLLNGDEEEDLTWL